MAATTGYQAGVETNATQLSYVVEATWGTAPVSAFQAIRYTSESLSLNKTRQRPTEITGTREAQQAVTTQQQAGGSINFAFSYATFDDFMSVALGNDWGAAQTIAGIAGDITLTNTSGTVVLSSTLGTKFSAIVAGSWIRTLGFTNANNNTWWFVSIKTDNSHLTLTGPNQVAPNAAVTETPATTLAQVRAQTMKNGTQFKSLFVQQKFASNQWLTYPGAYVTKFTLQGGVGSFLSGSVDLVAKSENKSTTDSSNGTITAAPSGRVIDPISGFVGVYWNEAILGTLVDQFAITIENTGAAPEFALGSTAAGGILGGTFQVSGTFRAYFNSFTQYDLFQAETAGRLGIVIKDSTGVSYAFTFLNAVLLGQISSGGPGQAVYATFTVEGGPSTNAAIPGTFVIDKLVAT